MKFFLDQSVCSIVNILLFIWLITLLKGQTLAATWSATFDDFGPLMIARLKFRPIVSLLMYTVIPVERRVVFGSACGVVWGIYLSLYAAV
jgi:protein Mpv17